MQSIVGGPQGLFLARLSMFVTPAIPGDAPAYMSTTSGLLLNLTEPTR
ncbi:MAG: hypothetical protein JWO64_2158 [Hyphomicrobiales bacterium]|nr:hypothetical protein [Hyphomicrobiales bacterium]